MSDTSAVEFEIIGVERCRRGPIIGLARVALVIDGIEIVLDGFTIRERGDQIEVSVPTYRNPVSGAWWPVVGIPAELQDKIAVAVCEALGGEAITARQASTVVARWQPESGYPPVETR